MERDDARSGAEFLDQPDCFVYDAGILDDLTFTDFACPDLNASSRNNATNFPGEVRIDITCIFAAFDKFLANRVRYPFGVERQLITIVGNGVSSAGIAIPGL